MDFGREDAWEAEQPGALSSTRSAGADGNPDFD